MIAALLDRFQEWRDRQSAFREIRRQNVEAEPFEGQEQGRLIGLIKSAAFRGHAEDGLAAYNALLARAPDVATTSAVVMRSMMELKHFSVADAGLVYAQRKFPGHAELARLYAELAQVQGHWDVACERWAIIRKQYPEIGGAYTIGAIALGVVGRYEEANQLLDYWVKRDPDDVVGALEYAKVAENLGDLPLAAERWRRMQNLFHDVAAWIGEAKILSKLGHEEVALKVLETAQWKFQSSPLPMNEIALIVQSRGDDEESLRYWAKVRDHFPSSFTAYVLAAWILRDLGRSDDAEAMLLTFINRDLEAPEPALEYAMMAHGRSDWEEAARRWAFVRNRYPERTEGYTWGADAMAAVGDHDAASEIRAKGPNA